MTSNRYLLLLLIVFLTCLSGCLRADSVEQQSFIIAADNKGQLQFYSEK